MHIHYTGYRFSTLLQSDIFSCSLQNVITSHLPKTNLLMQPTKERDKRICAYEDKKIMVLYLGKKVDFSSGKLLLGRKINVNKHSKCHFLKKLPIVPLLQDRM